MKPAYCLCHACRAVLKLLTILTPLVQVNLKWLDLSFNHITKIVGLDKLGKLVDLSLFNNQITEIDNLDKLVDLNVLSLGV